MQVRRRGSDAAMTSEDAHGGSKWRRFRFRSIGTRLAVSFSLAFVVVLTLVELIGIGGVPFTNPPRLDRDLQALMDAGVSVYAVAEDLASRGIRDDELIGGVKLVPQGGVAKLFDDHDAIWHW